MHGSCAKSEQHAMYVETNSMHRTCIQVEDYCLARAAQNHVCPTVLLCNEKSCLSTSVAPFPDMVQPRSKRNADATAAVSAKSH